MYKVFKDFPGCQFELNTIYIIVKTSSHLLVFFILKSQVQQENR